MNPTPVRVLHGSDLHVESTPDGTRGVARFIDAAIALDVDLVLMAGDTFDNPRILPTTFDDFNRHVARAQRPVVILPGNHDPLRHDGVYKRHALAENAVLLDDPRGTTRRVPGLDVDVWGRPHMDWADNRPLADPPPRGPSRWQIGLAHGHLVRGREDLHRSYLITSDEIAACDRDYLALGHWDVQTDVSSGPVTAWYSGSPTRYQSCVLVTLSEEGNGRHVRVEPVRLPD